MSARKLALSLSLLVLVFLAAVAYISFKLFGFGYCKISLISKSSLVNISITDQDKFEDFVKKYAPCKYGKFSLGDPYSKVKDYDSGILEFVITDTEYANVMNSVDENGNKTPIYSHLYNFSEKNKLIIYLQFDESIDDTYDFNLKLPFFLAARLVASQNYNDPQSWLERTQTYQDFNVSSIDIGINYEFND